MTMRDALNTDARRAYAPDTGKRTAKLDAMRAEYLERKTELMGDEDLTPEAKNRYLQELERDFREGFDAEAERVTGRLDREIEDAYRKAHGPEKPSPDAQAEVAKEMRLSRVRSEVYEDLASGHDALIDYERAVRLGDAERAGVLAKVGPGWLDDPARRRRLRQLVEENLPEERKEAKRDLERLEAEKRHVELGLALGRNRRRAG